MDLPLSPKTFPDTKTSYIKLGDKFVLFGSAGPLGVRLEGQSLTNLQDVKLVLKPTPEDGETPLGVNGYKAFSGVFRGRSDDELIGLYHQEFWPKYPQQFPFNAQIGLAVSYDKGYTWEDKGPVITGDYVDPNAPRVTGVGQPSPVVAGKNVFIYYTNWGEGNANICLAKAPLANIDNPSAWSKWYAGKFQETGLGGRATPVLTSPDGVAALISVSWNTKLDKFLAVYERGFEKEAGFYIATSEVGDGINWRDQQVIARFPQPHSVRKSGDIWYSYPTLISETDNQFITNEKGVLLVSRGEWNRKSHKGVLIPFKIGDEAKNQI